jgi:hypothetical protein
MDGESTIAAKTRSRKRTATEVAPAAEMPAATEVTPAAAEMPSAEMPSAMATAMKMPSTVTTSAVAAAAMTAAATFGDGIARSRQRGSKNKDGNSNPEF